MMHSATPSIVIAGEGGPDALVPSVAVADQLQTLLPEVRTVFTGSGSSDEYRRVARAGYLYWLVGSPGGGQRKPRLVDRLTRFAAERHFLRSVRPAAVVSAGGTVGERMGRAAAALGLPLVVLEHDAMPSRATRYLAPLADLVCLGYQETRVHLRASCPIRVTGIPLPGRRASERRDSPHRLPRALADMSRRLIVLADRIGHYRVNAVLPYALSRLQSRLQGWRVVHQAGADDVRAVKLLYRDLGIDAVATPHIHNLPSLLDKADLAIADASSATLAEATAAGVPLILAPAHGLWNRRQLKTARMLARHGACAMVERADREREWARVLDRLLVDRRRRQRLSTAMQRHFRSDAAWQIASMIHDIVRSAVRCRSA